ncbi:MAG: hypothetical protein H7308_10495 [Chthonomonadaceae bacterium]|nr:hypothetical protein [Chthonomonadaceae bacterium]
MSLIPYPQEEAYKSALLLQATLFRAEGQEEDAASRFAEVATLEERLAQRADAEGEGLRAIRSRFSAASAWANAGDFHHALTLLQTLEQRSDVPDLLKERARTFAETLRLQRRQWQETLQEVSLS